MLTAADVTCCRLGARTRGRPCVLWVSGRVDPGVAAVGRIASHVREEDGGPVVDVEAGCNPSYPRPREWAAVTPRL